jgi:Tfp pilus assembly protein PilF
MLMKRNISQNISIAKQIVDGSISLQSSEEFKSILRIFPNDPALHRVFADYLVSRNKIEEAMASYRKAATLNIESGMMLQAIKIRIGNRPSAFIGHSAAAGIIKRR